MFQHDQTLLALAQSRQRELYEAAEDERRVRIYDPNRGHTLGKWATRARCWMEHGWANGRQWILSEHLGLRHAATTGPQGVRPACSEQPARQ
jgi:hypothetical protein